jgi:peptide/nickel transport system substrate-binding protein
MQTSLLNGGIDIALTDDATTELLDDLAAQQDEGTLNVDYLPNPIWEHLDFNTDFTLLSDERARQAIAYGTNRQAMTEALFGERVPVLDSWIVPDHWAAAPTDQLTQYPYDPDRARELLEELDLVDLDDDGIREQGIDFDSDDVLESSTAITLTLMITENTPLRAAIAERFQEDMATIGLTVNVLELPPQELFGLNGPLFRRQFELTQFAWIASPDPRGFELWGCAAVPGPTNAWTGSNLSGWCHREANQTIITATTSLDFETRKEAYTRHQQIFTEELPVIPLFQRLTVVMHNPRIQGIRPDPIAPLTWNIAEWSRLE